MSERKKVFLGYCVFYAGEPFPSSGNTVTRDRRYLQSYALFKLNKLPHPFKPEDYRRKVNADSLRRIWVREPKLTLRRVYAQ